MIVLLLQIYDWNRTLATVWLVNRRPATVRLVKVEHGKNSRLDFEGKPSEILGKGMDLS